MSTRECAEFALVDFMYVLLCWVFVVVVLHEYGVCGWCCCFVPMFVVPYKPSC
ncbi:MAG: hypothetical protein RXN78_07590 [Vulcanisaeta sp.]